MADDQNPLDKILDTVHDNALDAWAFIKYPFQTSVAKTAWAYFKALRLWAVNIFPALGVFLSGQTAISQEVARKPDEHLASQSESTDTTLESSNTQEAVFVSANAMPLTNGNIFTVMTPPPTRPHVFTADDHIVPMPPPLRESPKPPEPPQTPQTPTSA